MKERRIKKRRSNEKKERKIIVKTRNERGREGKGKSKEAKEKGKQ